MHINMSLVVPVLRFYQLADGLEHLLDVMMSSIMAKCPVESHPISGVCVCGLSVYLLANWGGKKKNLEWLTQFCPF